MKKVTAVILIDGLRYDYVNRKDAPFLYFLQKSGMTAILKEPFAFQLRPAFFAGLYPEDCDIGHMFWYDPGDSPFYFTRELFVPEIVFTEPYLKKTLKEFLTKEARKTEMRKCHTASCCYAETFEIPYHLLRYFAFSEKYNIFQPNSLPSLTLFDILRRKQLTWLWYAYPTAQDSTVDGVMNAFKNKLKDNLSLIYLHFSELDWIGHSYGPGSKKRRETLRKIDQAVREIDAQLHKSYDEVIEVIFGDHGMVEVGKVIDIEENLRKLVLEVPGHYVYFLDSTQARFWFKDENAKGVIEKMLSNFGEGRILGNQDYEKLHIRYKHNKFGDLFFVLEGGSIIFPNFFQRGQIPKGMHGYLPEEKRNWSRLIISGVNKNREINKPIEMVDLFPTILDLIGVSIPSRCKGRSILTHVS